MDKKVIYYRDALHDDFANNNIEAKPLREDFKYIHTNFLWRMVCFVLYRLIAQPLVFLFVKLVYGQRFANKAVLKQAKGSGAYVYANHTNGMLDAFVPNLLRYSGRGYIVVGPGATSIPGLTGIVQMLGAIPLGSTFAQCKQMRRCVQTRVKEKNLVTIYPEAHIWPYYTGIRPFPATSFGYPAYDGAPVFAMTNCYQKRRFGGFPKVVTYLDGPFYPDASLPMEARKKKLRDQCYEAMQARAKEYSTYAYVTYVKEKTDGAH